MTALTIQAPAELLNIKTADKLTGGLSNPGKMPGPAFNTPAARCNVGSSLRAVENSVCSHCYACSGRYQFNNVQTALERRYQALMHEPRWVEAMIYLLVKKKHTEHFRWFDSGDIPNLTALLKIVSVVKQTPDTQHWLPTREIGVLGEYIGLGHTVPENMVFRVSMNFIGQEARLPKNLQNVPGIETSVFGGEEDGTFVCPSLQQNNTCGDCRHCWERSGLPTNYIQHGR